MPQCQITVRSPHTEQIAERAGLLKHNQAHTLGFLRRRRLGVMYSDQRHVGTAKLKLAGRMGRGGRGAGEQTGSRGGKHHTLIRASLQELRWESVPRESTLGDP